MTKQLTDSERQVLPTRQELWQLYLDAKPLDNAWKGYEHGYESGFIAGLLHNQSKLDKLIAYIKGDLKRFEIEDIING